MSNPDIDFLGIERDGLRIRLAECQQQAQANLDESAKIIIGCFVALKAARQHLQRRDIGRAKAILDQAVNGLEERFNFTSLGGATNG